MAQTYTNLRDRVENILQDSANAIWSTAELDYHITDALREVSEYVPHIVVVPYTIESRTGTASSTTASHLVDTSESQFVSGDVGKIVHNTTDNTWAEVTAYTSTSDITLSKDIMASGENYEMFNPECTNNKQINISDVIDYLWIVKAQYPVGTDRNIKVSESNPNIIELDMTREPDDSKVLSSGDQPDTEVYIFFAKRHKVSQLTDLVGAVNLLAGYAAGSTSIILDALQDSGTVEADQELTIASTRGVYTVTADATIATNAATIYFYPGLQSTVADNAVVTFKSTTLTPILETILCEYAAGLALQSEGISQINTVTTGGGAVAQAYLTAGERRIGLAKRTLNSLARKENYEYSKT